MTFDVTYIPSKPFADFKWRWACLTCTESLNDPVILLGVLKRMRKLEGKTYSSHEFSDELTALENDVKDSITVSLSHRGGSRNLIRNSGQYWKALGLIEKSSRGIIQLTDFGRKVSDHDISQSEFSAVIIKTLILPNKYIQSDANCDQWAAHGIKIKPLKLILNILVCLYEHSPSESFMTADELIKIIIPLSTTNALPKDYAQFLLWFRAGSLNIERWPNCTPKANDKRMAREFLLFLENYGYLAVNKSVSRYLDKYCINSSILSEIKEIIDMVDDGDELPVLNHIRTTDLIQDIERKRIITYRIERPNQNIFRKNILSACRGKCVITGISLREVLEAAHIKPVKYKGNDSVGNGICLRLDLHQLFDTGHLRIALNGRIILSKKSAPHYSPIIPEQIVLPEFVNQDYLRWRWDNYNGI